MGKNKYNNCLKNAHFTADECIHLCEILDNYRHMIEVKKNDGPSVQDKHNSWLKVVEEYNATSTTKRSLECLRQCYKNLRRKVRALLTSWETRISGGMATLTQPETVLFNKVYNLMSGPALPESHGDGKKAYNITKYDLMQQHILGLDVDKEMEKSEKEANGLDVGKKELNKLRKELIMKRIQVEEVKLKCAQLEKAEQEEKIAHARALRAMEIQECQNDIKYNTLVKELELFGFMFVISNK